MGNTFGATALSSYGGFWIAYGLIFTPAWDILDATAGPYKAHPTDVNSALGFFLTGWFIFTTILLLCTLRSTVMFFMLFFTLDLAFLMLACGEYAKNNGAVSSSATLTKAGGGFGMLAAFLAWYNAFAGIADSRYVILFGPLQPTSIRTNGLTVQRTATPSSSSRSSTSHGPRRPARPGSSRRRAPASKRCHLHGEALSLPRFLITSFSRVVAECSDVNCSSIYAAVATSGAGR